MIKKIVPLLIFLCIILGYTISCSKNQNKISGTMISERLYDLNYISKDKGVNFCDVDFYDESTILISYNNSIKKKIGYRSYNINTGELLYDRSIDGEFYPKIKKFEDKSFALYDRNHFVLFESIEGNSKLIKYFDENTNSNEYEELNEYIFYSKSNYYYVENAVLYDATFDGKKKVLIDMSDSYNEMWSRLIGDKYILIQCSNYENGQYQTLIYDISKEKINDAKEYDSMLPYIFDDVTLIQGGYSNIVKIFSHSNDKYEDEITLDNYDDGEMIIFADENLMWTHEYPENSIDDKEISRIYSLEDGSLLYKGDILSGYQYTYNYGDFSDNKEMAIIGLSEDNEYEEFGVEDTKFFIVDMKNLSSIEKQKNPYENIERYCKEISQRYGIEIFIEEEAIGNFPDFTGEVLKNKEQIIGSLRAIDEVLSKLPKGFIKELCSKTYKNSLTGINIYITGKLSPTIEYAVSNPEGYAYNDYELMKYCIVLDGELPMYYIKDNIKHEVMHIIESRITQYDFNNFDGWYSFLSKGSNYNYSYLDYEESYSYTIDDDLNEVCFINTYSKTFPAEDRAEIFKILFSDSEEKPQELSYPLIYEKAKYLCEIIRNNFESVKKSNKVYWERFID